ncbi:Cupredoxin-like domain protein [uncultured archaeon]|nr:Cupredoxin-like domain protein [uncultured archaeon]
MKMDRNTSVVIIGLILALWIAGMIVFVSASGTGKAQASGLTGQVTGLVTGAGQQASLQNSSSGAVHSCSASGGCGCGGGLGNSGTPQDSANVKQVSAVASSDGKAQDVYVKALGTGYYDNQKVIVKEGVPVRFHFSAEPSAGCGRLLVIPDFKVQLVSNNGEEQVAEFTPQVKGTYAYRCGMNMFRGVLVVE